MISYDPLWKTMKKQGITKYRLIKEHGFSNGTIDRLRGGEHVSTYTVARLCRILKCQPNDIFRILHDK